MDLEGGSQDQVNILHRPVLETLCSQIEHSDQRFFIFSIIVNLAICFKKFNVKIVKKHNGRQ